MKKYLIISVIIYFFIGFGLDLLNYLNWTIELPKEISQIYNAKEYISATEYAKDKFSLNMIASFTIGILILLALIFDWFGKLDNFISKRIKKLLIQGIVFFVVLNIIFKIIDLPFSYYYNFVIEEKFGFNKMNLSLFLFDNIKYILISSIFLSIYNLPMIKFILKQKEAEAKNKKMSRKHIFYLYSFLVGFITFIMIFGTSIFIPLFNDLKPINNIELKKEISEVAKKENIDLEGIYIIDGSKRSSKANAFFTGFGPTKKIVLYDTLIKDFTKEEIIAVLYHEIGHYKLKHIIYNLIISILILTLFFALGLKYENHKNDWVTGKVFFKNNSIQIGLLNLLIITLPFFIIFPILNNSISRYFEYQADNYSIERYNPEAMKKALIRLSKSSKGNVSPHPLYEIFYYSHPSILKRLENIDKYKILNK